MDTGCRCVRACVRVATREFGEEEGGDFRIAAIIFSLFFFLYSKAVIIYIVFLRLFSNKEECDRIILRLSPSENKRKTSSVLVLFFFSIPVIFKGR